MVAPPPSQDVAVGRRRDDRGAKRRRARLGRASGRCARRARYGSTARSGVHAPPSRSRPAPLSPSSPSTRSRWTSSPPCPRRLTGGHAQAHARIRRIGLQRLGAATRAADGRGRSAGGSRRDLPVLLGRARRGGAHRHRRPRHRAGRERVRLRWCAGDAGGRGSEHGAAGRRQRARRGGGTRGFHARFSAVARSYRYVVLNRASALCARGAALALVAATGRSRVARGVCGAPSRRARLHGLHAGGDAARGVPAGDPGGRVGAPRRSPPLHGDSRLVPPAYGADARRDDARVDAGAARAGCSRVGRAPTAARRPRRGGSTSNACCISTGTQTPG